MKKLKNLKKEAAVDLIFKKLKTIKRFDHPTNGKSSISKNEFLKIQNFVNNLNFSKKYIENFVNDNVDIDKEFESIVVDMVSDKLKKFKSIPNAKNLRFYPEF